MLVGKEQRMARDAGKVFGGRERRGDGCSARGQLSFLLLCRMSVQNKAVKLQAWSFEPTDVRRSPIRQTCSAEGSVTNLN